MVKEVDNIKSQEWIESRCMGVTKRALGGGEGGELKPPSFWQPLKNIKKMVLNKVYCIKNVQTVFVYYHYMIQKPSERTYKFPGVVNPPRPPRMHWHALHAANFSKPHKGMLIIMLFKFFTFFYVSSRM